MRMKRSENAQSCCLLIMVLRRTKYLDKILQNSRIKIIDSSHDAVFEREQRDRNIAEGTRIHGTLGTNCSHGNRSLDYEYWKFITHGNPKCKTLQEF